MVMKIEMQAVSRRDIMKLSGAGAAAFVATTLMPGLAQATVEETAAEISKIAAGKEVKSGNITLELPQIAENGNTVPVGFSVDSPMTDANYVKSVTIFAEQNPQARVATYRFTPANGKAKISTRMRLAKTQNVLAVAEMSDGGIYLAKSEVKVTIGGCGG